MPPRETDDQAGSFLSFGRESCGADAHPSLPAPAPLDARKEKETFAPLPDNQINDDHSTYRESLRFATPTIVGRTLTIRLIKNSTQCAFDGTTRSTR